MVRYIFNGNHFRLLGEGATFTEL